MTRLTAEQRRAVDAAPGPVRVLAGAGTGKTTVIVERFLRLLRAGVAPDRILVMTFTERAASEMRRRIEARAGADAAPAVGTFHALAQGWLRQDGPAVHVPERFRIISGAERWILAWELLWQVGEERLVDVEHPEHLVGPLLRVLERLKQELIPVARLEAWARAEVRRERQAADAGDAKRARLLLAASKLFRAYGRECRRRRVLDFDDLLERSVALFESRPEVLRRYRERYPYVLVDEYQDTNLAQERIVELLAQESREVFVVGDDDQSIYRFRGASRASMERFARSFSTAVTLTLTRNRRSTGRIVGAAGRLIENNADRLPKPLTAVRSAGPGIQVWRCADGAAEGAAIAAEILRLRSDGLALREMAVLTRTNAVADPIAKALRGAGIPIDGGGWWAFLDRPVAKDLVAALRLVADGSDPVAAERLAAGFGRLAPRAWGELRARLAAAARTTGVGDLLFELMSGAEYLEDRTAEEVRDGSQFGELVADFCERTADQSLGAFLDHLRLVELSGLDVEAATEPAEAPPDAVRVMTIHQAKGLEFEAVFVPTLVEGRLPQPARRERLALPAAVLEPTIRGRQDHLAEERRLCYVAMTRARTHLYLSWADRYEGDRGWRRSQFLDEVLGAGGSACIQVEVPGGGEVAAPPKPASAPGARRPVPLSFSALSTYRECPRRHWFRYVRRLPAAATAAGHLGDAVHRALLAAGRRRLEGQGVDATEIRALLDGAWAQTPFPEPRLEPVYRRLAEEMVVRYVEAGGFDRRLSNVEHPFETPLDGTTLKGVIDRIDDPDEPGGPHLLIDYKTGARLPVSRLRRDLQLALYALGAKRSLGLAEVELEIAYLRDGRRVRLPAGEELLAEAERLAVEAAHGIQRSEFEPRPDRRRCRACPYRLACDAAL